MGSFWLGFVIGMFVGGNAGVFVFALLNAADAANRRAGRFDKP